MSITLEKLPFGVFAATEDKIILSHLILIANFYLYKCKLNIIYPSFKVFVAKVKITYQMERKFRLIKTDFQPITKNGPKFYPVTPNY